MASWSEFETSAPEFGAAVHRLLVGADGVAIGFLATVSTRGNPYLSPVCPIFARCAGAGSRIGARSRAGRLDERGRGPAHARARTTREV